MSSEKPSTRYDVSRGIATITLDRPENSNALTGALMNSLGDNLARALGDEAVRVVLLTNEGRAFCAGANLKGGGDEEPRYNLVDIFDRILDSPKPIVGRIAGHCTGGGVGLAASCDISVVADDVKIGFTEVRIGVAPAIISVICLPKMRRGDAMELFLSGERIPSMRAAEVGLFNRAVPRAVLDAAVSEVIEKLLLGGPLALAASKSLVVRVPKMERKAAFEWTAKLSAERFASDEAEAGIGAFRDKTTAPWVPK